MNNKTQYKIIQRKLNNQKSYVKYKEINYRKYLKKLLKIF